MSGEVLQNIKTKVEECLAKVPAVDHQMQKIADRIKVEKAYVTVGILSFVVLMVYLIGGGEILLDAIGFVYPAYCSIKAIESNDKNDDTQWLSYWLVFGLFKVFESVADFMISSIPFYFLIKVAFLVYLFLPQTQGAKVIYENVIRTHIVPHLGINTPSDKKSD